MDSQKTWNNVLLTIKQQITASNYKTWFSNTKLKELSEIKIVLTVPSAFVKGQLISRYEGLIKQSLEKVIGHDLEIEYFIDPSAFAKPQAVEDGADDYFNFQPQSSPQTPQNNLNPKYTLENFVVGLTNNLAFAAAQAVVKNPGISYNPLFIYGPSGVGKTHLMHAIGNAITQNSPYSRLIYATSERFMNDFVDSIQNKRTADFRARYRNCQLLLVDDIQFISGKDSTQEEFFHTFNELSTKNSQLVLTSDRPPNEIIKLESRLQSRFQGGLMVDIQLPDFDTRVAILKAKLQERGESLPEEILNMIAENVESNTRELEGKLISILQNLKLSNQSPSVETVKKLLGQSLSKTKSLDHKKILATINQYFSLKMADLIGPRRQKELVLPRQIAMYVLYEEGHLPMEKVGQLLGGRDHTTVLHGIDKIRQAMQRDREIQRLVIEVKQSLMS